MFRGPATVIKPDKPVDELLRLETLRSLKLLDTDPEERFDRVTRLAKRLFNTRIALVSLVDSERQWFKSRQGLDATETGRDISFCGHAILGDDVLVVNDTHIDERFSDNPLVTDDPRIRFYAGCPLSAPNGRKVGTLCVIDEKTREMSDDDLQLLRELGRMVEEEFAVASVLSCDPITGVSNHSGFLHVAAHLFALCDRTDLPVTLLQFKLPNLELIRDALGDDGADRAVTELTQLLLANLRESDVIGRVADDTFLVLLTGTDEHSVGVARDRILAMLDTRNAMNDASFELEVNATSLSYDRTIHDSVQSLVDGLLEGSDDLAEATGQWKLAQAV